MFSTSDPTLHHYFNIVPRQRHPLLCAEQEMEKKVEDLKAMHALQSEVSLLRRELARERALEQIRNDATKCDVVFARLSDNLEALIARGRQSPVGGSIQPATLHFPDGKQGPPLELHALFQQFFDEVSKD
jgi:hypothetical protein